MAPELIRLSEHAYQQELEGDPHAGEAQDGAAAHAGAPRVSEAEAPSTEDLPIAEVAAIVKSHGLERLLKALLSVAPRADVTRAMQQLCDKEFRDEPVQQLEDGREVPTCSIPARPRLPRHALITCRHHTDYVGGGDAITSALNGVFHGHEAAHDASPSSVARLVNLQIRALLALRARVWARGRHLRRYEDLGRARLGDQ